MSVVRFTNFYELNGATAFILIHSDSDTANPTIDGDAAIPTICFDFEFPGVVSTLVKH